MQTHRKLMPIFILPVLLAGSFPSAIHAAPSPSKDAEHYYAVMVDGKRAGYDHDQRTRMPSGEITALSDSLLKVSMLGSSLDVSTQGIAELAADGVTPLTYAMTLARGPNTTTVKCRFSRRTVAWSQMSQGQTTSRTITLAPGTRVMTDNGSWSELFRSAPAAAKSFKATIFTPLLGQSDTITLTRSAGLAAMIGGKPIRCDLWATSLPTVAGPQPATIAVRSDTREVAVIKMPSQNVVMQLADKAALKGLVNFDATSRAFAATDVTLPDAQRLTQVSLHAVAKIMLEPITAQSLQHGPRQTFTGTVKQDIVDGVFTVRAYRYDGVHAASLPYTKEAVGAQAKWLKPDNFSESDDPQIRALAAKLTLHSQTGWEAAAKIGHWVFDNITYRITGASAKTCLATKEGDCGPHTNLTVALCRAAGIPARMTGGALYTSMLGGSYGQHYWVDVWMGTTDGWVPIDPTTGEVGTLSPAHLTLWDFGGLGSLSVKILDYAPKAPIAAATVSNAAAEPHHPNGLQVGYKEKYVFRIDGKEIGAQTAALESIAGDAQTWNYAVNLNVPMNGQNISMAESSTLIVSDTGHPVKVTVAAEVSGVKQDVAMDFDKTIAHAVISSGTVKSPRDVSLTGGEFVALGNVLSTFSLALRSTELTGKTVAIPFILVDSLQPVTITFTPAQAETITINGKTYDCQCYKVQPLNETFWLEKSSGALVKSTDIRQKLEITRE